MFVLEAKRLEDQLTALLNNCGLPVSDAYYIVENMALQLKLLYYQDINKTLNTPPEDTVGTTTLKIPEIQGEQGTQQVELSAPDPEPEVVSESMSQGDEA